MFVKDLLLDKRAKNSGAPRSTLSDRLTAKAEAGKKWSKARHLSFEDKTDFFFNTAANRVGMGIGFNKVQSQVCRGICD